MHLPNYKDGSIVNLMSSLGKSFGGKTGYGSLRLLPPRELKSKYVVLLLIDGMGYEFIKRYGKKSIFWKHLRGKMTSVFPSTTAASITTINTGVAPQQH